MADVSLDEYIKSDFRSREPQGNIRKNKPSHPLYTNKLASRSSVMKRMTYLNQKLPIKQHINSGNQVVSANKLQTYRRHDKVIPRKQELHQFDARLKLSAKSFKDAREKISSNVIDARHKIQNSQAKKYVQDARKKISMKRNLNTTRNNPKITVMGFGNQHPFKNSALGKTTTSGANIIRTVNNSDHQSRLRESNDVAINLKRTLTNELAPSDSSVYSLGNCNMNSQLGMSNIHIHSHGARLDNDKKLQITKNIASKVDERSNIATYEPLRGPVIQLKNDHYQEKSALPKSMDYDYEHFSGSGYSHLASSVRHLSPSSPWLLRLSNHSLLSSSMARRGKYELTSSPSKPSLPLERENVIKFPRQSRDLGIAQSATKRMKPSNVELHDQFPSDVLTSSLSVPGYRVLVTNLHPIVTQDDIIELFGAVGALKKAHLLKPGCAEVVYLSYNDAVAAVNKYHNRELDGQPMTVKQTTPVSTVSSLHSSNSSTIPKSLGEPLKFRKDLNSSTSNPKVDATVSSRSGVTTQASSTPTSSVVDVNLIHKALFSSKSSSGGTSSTASSTQPGSRPVTFTVKI